GTSRASPRRLRLREATPDAAGLNKKLQMQKNKIYRSFLQVFAVSLITSGFVLSTNVNAQKTTIITFDVPLAKDTFPLGINPKGDIVGWYYDASFNAHGFLLSNGTLATIDVPKSTSTTLFRINPQGDIVGQYSLTNVEKHGFLLSRGTFSNIDVPP